MSLRIPALLKSLVIRGMYHEGGEIPLGTPIVARNYAATPNPDLREGFDGIAWEHYGDPGVTIRTMGHTGRCARRLPGTRDQPRGSGPRKHFRTR
ncbi:MAG TPA: hypothetical protein VGM43_25915 [Bryobacteraceae bacterium]